jgi:CRP-like cAMP-binding protein
MSNKELEQQILSISPFTEKELMKISSHFVSHKYRQKDYILTAGKTAKEIHFIINGLARVFYLKNGKEVTSYLACDNSFVSSYSSFINKTCSFENIQCIEDCETLSISYERMQELYKEIPNWEKVGRILAEQNYICMADRVLKLQMITAKEKYLTFLETAPYKIIQRTPLIYIASYLGITPESLSRIRQSIS